MLRTATTPPGSTMATQLNDILNRWSASVRVDGKVAEVFKVEHTVNKTTCYIEAIEGKEFEVTVHSTQDPGYDQVYWLTVDGVRIDGASIRRFLHQDLWTCKGKQVSQSALRPFVFAPIALTDDVNAATKNEDVLKGLGAIRLDFYRTVYTGQVANTASYADDVSNHVVDEKCKKAKMSHTTSFGAPKTTTASQYTARTEHIDPFGSPRYSLVFQYRGRDLLEAEGIIEGALPVVAPRQRSASDSPPVEIESIAKASTSTSTSSGRQSKKRKKQIELTLAESSDEDDGSDLRAKVAKVEAASGEARVKTEPGKRVKFEPGVKAEKVNVKVSRENGKVVLDILDD
ncbi:hypothetical protein BMF94_5636 [Rhodotorula taiwanensis]|uniref:DUF7918 domain-containing protein n=1 Tax=Rhodotorula taiwanensis TaxID=741276 RepID=A0A2S5B3G0_9BASI|nr:hypothetical protein BMF94_5636 [Rhodotorula taiwanensis]